MTALPLAHHLARIAIIIVAATLVGLAGYLLLRTSWPQQAWHVAGQAIDAARRFWTGSS